MTGFQGDAEQIFQLLQQNRIVIPRRPVRSTRAALGPAAARGVVGRTGRGVPQWAPSDMSNSTRWFNPTSDVGDYASRTDTFTRKASGSCTHLSWDGYTNSTLMAFTGLGIGGSIGSETINGVSYRSVSNILQAITNGTYSKTAENMFYAFCVKLTSFASKGLAKVGTSTNGYQLSFDSDLKPVVTIKNSSADTTEYVATGTFAATADEFQVHVIQRFGSSLTWTINGSKCIDETTSYVGGSGSAVGNLFKGFAASTTPTYELLEYFRSDSTATRQMDRLKAEGYLCDKYGITLPRDHRFRRSPPGR